MAGAEITIHVNYLKKIPVILDCMNTEKFIHLYKYIQVYYAYYMCIFNGVRVGEEVRKM